MISRTDPIAWIDAVVAADPGRSFLRLTNGEVRSYGALAADTGRMAAVLAAQGVKPGDRVAAQIEKSPAGVVLYLACLWAGAIFVPLNTGYTAAEMDYFISDAEPVLIVCDPGQLDLLTGLANGGAKLLTLDAEGRGSLADLFDATVSPAPRVELDGDALAAFLYTSGTTGRPKGAMLTRGNLASSAATLVEAWRFTRDDVLLHALPIFHVHGLFVAINTVLAAGASMLFVPKFDAGEALALLPQVTALMGVPTFYTRLLNEPGLTREATAHMRLFVSGSAPLLAETHRAFEARTGHPVLERYGMTETQMNTSNPYDGPRVPGTVGPPLSGVELRVTNPETGARLADGEIGMIEVRGPNVFKGYWRNLQKTAEDMRADGFFITGDLGKIDEAGYVHIIGRGKDLIISGGFNVYPKEVETEIDGIDGVVESAVIGVPHPDFGEGVTAVVVRAPDAALDADAVAGQLAERLAKFKLPKSIHFVDDLPRNTMGKVQKNLLRQQYEGIYRG